MERLFITALESITSLGRDQHSLWQALLKGQCGIAPVEHFDTQWLPMHRAAEIKTFSQWPQLTPEENHALDPAVQLTLACSRSVLAQAALLMPDGKAGQPQLPLFLATTQGDFLAHIQHLQKTWLNDAPALGEEENLPVHRPGYPTSSVLTQTARALGLQGWLVLNSNACAAGGYALASAVAHLRQGLSAQALCVGVDITSPYIFSGFCSLRVLAPDFCRPFDRHRQGLVLGDGCAALLLETESSLKRRQAQAKAEVLGYGWSNDAYHLVAPQPQGQGMVQAMSQALKDSRLGPDEVDGVFAHGTGTIANDMIEANALVQVFGGRAVPVTAAKAAVGHTIAAAGLIEACLAITSLNQQVLPPTVNHEQPDPQCPVNVVSKQPRPGTLRTCLTNAAAFGGANCAVVFKAVEN